MLTSTAAVAVSGDSSKTIIGSSVEDRSLEESGAAQSQSYAQNEVQELEKLGKQINPSQPGEAQSSVAISSDQATYVKQQPGKSTATVDDELLELENEKSQETNRSRVNDHSEVPHDSVLNIACSSSSKFRSHVDDTRDIDSAVQDAVLREQELATQNIIRSQRESLGADGPPNEGPDIFLERYDPSTLKEHLLKITSEHRAEMAMKRGKLNLPEEGWYFVMWLPLPIEVFVLHLLLQWLNNNDG